MQGELKISPPSKYNIRHVQSLDGTCVYPAVVCPGTRYTRHNEMTCHCVFYKGDQSKSLTR